MRARSRKMQALYVLRRRLVAEFLSANPMCQRCRFDRSTDVHEVKTRARGGSILDEANLMALCRPCHSWIGEHPRQAHAEGFLRNSWEAS